VPGLGTVDLPAAATVTMLLVWQTNGQTAGGLDSTVHIGGGLPGG